jgi:hypothetical protein
MPVMKGVDLEKQLASLQPPAPQHNSSGSPNQTDNESDDPQVVQPDAPLQKLRDMFVSPLGETTQTAIVVNCGIIRSVDRAPTSPSPHGRQVCAADPQNLPLIAG